MIEEPGERNQSEKPNDVSKATITMLGALLVIGGFIILLDSRLQTGWLSWLMLPGIGLAFIAATARSRKMRLLVPGCLLAGVGLGLFLSFGALADLDWQRRVGVFLLSLGMSWFLIALLGYHYFRRTAWWAMITGAVIVSTALAFLNGPLNGIIFAFFIGAGLGLVLLAWGVAEHLFGLIIPGCLLLGIGPGLYLAWRESSEPNSLARTGIMLVSFALGWGLITMFSRVITHKFVWWPLIPGGILAMVGWGLYIGGNPDNALSFIGNTGSIGLIFFGIYLLLLRRGIHN